MIKTHKPRGHFWTCASVFQQSKQMRNIKLEDCTPPVTETLASGSDDDIRPSDRAAKRRRVEKLADDFLNGVPLLITSARPSATSLKGTVEWNERSRIGSKWSLPVPEREEDSVMWVDVQDDWTVLSTSSVMRKTKRKATSGPLSPQPQKTITRTVTVTELQAATSGCKPARRVKAPNVFSEPSTEAMKHAAALRARKLQRATTEVPLPVDDEQRSSILDPGLAEPHSEPASIARPRYFRTRKPASTEWLLRRQTTLHELSPDESIDELSRSRTETPSRTQRISAVQQRYSPVRLVSSGDATVCDTDTRPDTRPQVDDMGKTSDVVNHIVSSADPLSLSFSQKLLAATEAETSGSAANGSYCTTAEGTVVETSHAMILSPGDSQADSQTQLLKRQGIYAVPRRSWASTNEPESFALTNSPPAIPAEEDPVSDKYTTFRQCLQESAQHAGKPPKGKRAKSAGNNTAQATGLKSRRRSAPTESQNADEQMASLPVEQQRRMSAFRVSREKPAYTEVQPAQQGDTPFMFRKKRTTNAEAGAGSADTTTAKQTRKSCRRVTFPSSEGAQTVSKPRDEHVTRQVAAQAPVLDMSLGHDSSFGMRLNMALVDEHINAVLPEDPGSIRRSAIKRKLRQEMVESGAQLSRIDGEPPSSQVELQTHQILSSSEDVEDCLSAPDSEGRVSLRLAIAIARREPGVLDDTTAEDRQSAQTQWPGTQVAICQAQRDLFVSPEKSSTTAESTSQDTSKQSRAIDAPPSEAMARKPLRELPQEQSTQAMMESWSPWSIAKKSNAVTDRLTTRSPTVRGKSAAKRRPSVRLSSIASDPVTMVDDISQRRSSLLFSTTMSDSTVVSSRLQYPVSKPSSSVGNNTKSSFGASATPKSILKNATTPSQLSQSHIPLTWDPTTSISFEAVRSDPPDADTGPPAWTHEDGQGQPLSDDLDIERTVTELAVDVLGMTDMDGVLSQRS
ncbi:hypothetical protein LTR08_006979 [Meristemomyces frigidus]|nr:hypothetical protein LTR08_006979 [Meristemomyces frigidus]